MCSSPSAPDPVVIEKPVVVEKPVEKKVEKVADPTPTTVKPTDVGSSEQRVAEENQKKRNKKGYAATRVADDRSVLTDTAASDKRNTLG